MLPVGAAGVRKAGQSLALGRARMGPDHRAAHAEHLGAPLTLHRETPCSEHAAVAIGVSLVFPYLDFFPIYLSSQTGRAPTYTRRFCHV